MIWTKAMVQAEIRSGWILKNEVEDMWLGNTEKIGGGEEAERIEGWLWMRNV